MKKISVIIPTYNRAGLLQRSIQSVLQQTYVNLAVIVVDDASTDNTEDVIHSMQDERIHYIRMPENQGPAAARNRGVKEADTELIAFHDSDDVWLPDKLQRQMSYWESHPEYELIYCSYRMHGTDDSILLVPNEQFYGEREGELYHTLLINNTIGAPTVLMRRDVFLMLHGYQEQMTCLEDWEFALRLSMKYKIGFVEEPLVEAYQTTGSVSSKPADFYLQRCRMISDHRQELIQNQLFDLSVKLLFENAQRSGVLPMVQKMIMLMLKE